MYNLWIQGRKHTIFINLTLKFYIEDDSEAYTMEKENIREAVHLVLNI